MRKVTIGMLYSLISLLIMAAGIQAQEETTAVVRAVLFYSPSCPHCHEVLQNDLPPLKEQYGDQLQILLVDVTGGRGAQLYEAMIQSMNLPQNRLGVPALVVGQNVLVGSLQIPEQFPGIIAQGLETGGLDWPAIPGLQDVIPLPATAAPETAANEPVAPPVVEELQPDPLPTAGREQAQPPKRSGFTLAWFVMLGMVISLIYTLVRLYRRRSTMAGSPIMIQALSNWVIPILAIAGIGIAAYLAYVEINQVKAVCGPVGECNLVQSSPYALIMGIPVAVLGLIFYLGILAIWIYLKWYGQRSLPQVANLLLGLTIAGTLFSIYLTAIELAVIEAVCAWCLSSAVISTALMLFVGQALTNRAGPHSASAAKAAWKG